MKKKESPKDIRAKLQAQRQSGFKAAEEKRRQDVERARREAEERLEAEHQQKLRDVYQMALTEARSAPDYKPGRRRIAKAAGLKSTFTIHADELLMTSFGRGSEAVPEKCIKGNDVRSIAEKETLTVIPKVDTFGVTG